MTRIRMTRFEVSFNPIGMARNRLKMLLKLNVLRGSGVYTPSSSVPGVMMKVNNQAMTTTQKISTNGLIFFLFFIPYFPILSAILKASVYRLTL